MIVLLDYKVSDDDRKWALDFIDHSASINRNIQMNKSIWRKI